MKNQNRIHRNGAPKAAKSQAKIPPEKTVRIVINDEAGKDFADFEMTKAMHSAIVSDARSKGISVMQWIEDATRESLKNKKPAEPVASAPQFLIPSQVAIEAADALSIMESTGQAAIALAMLNAERIKTHSADDDGWQSMEMVGFGEGSVELARMVCTDFQVNFSDLDDGLRQMLKRIRDIHQPVSPVYDNRNSQLISSHYKNWRLDFENAVGALRDCLETQGEVLSNRTNHQIAHHSSCLLSKKLEAAFNALWDAQKNVHLAFLALEASTAGSSELRRAA